MGVHARVLRVSGPTATLRTEGAVVEARILPRLPGRPLVVGDEVDVRGKGADTVVVAIGPRRTLLERAQGPDGPRRPIVANADLVMIVESLANPDPRPNLIDRYLVAAWAGGLDAVVVLTKADLAGPVAAERLAGVYRDLGYPVITGCAKDPAMVEAVRAAIGGRTAALVGQSGVGKSTLTRALTGVDRQVGEVSGHVGGRHTTTDPRLIPMPGGGAVVDTAGVRSLFLPRMEPEDLAGAFPEIRDRSAECRFRDCRHLGDRGCAVAGHMADSRRESYRALLENP